MAGYFSTDRTNDRLVPPALNRPRGLVDIVPWEFSTSVALANLDTVELCRVPAGCRLLVGASFWNQDTPQGANTLIDIGYLSYKDKHGVVVTGDANGVVSGRSAALITTTSLGLDSKGVGNVGYGIIDFSDSYDDITLFATFLNGTGVLAGGVADLFGGYFTVIRG